MSQLCNRKNIDDTKCFKFSLKMDSSIASLHGEAMFQLGKLHEITSRLDSVDRLIKVCRYKEALALSSLEGVEGTLGDLFLQQLTATKLDGAAQCVINSVDALSKALSSMRKQNALVFEKCGEADKNLPAAIKVGLLHAHVQATRPLTTLLLVERGILLEPLLYPSLYFKRHHREYCELLDGVRTNGDVESWIKFYLTALKSSAENACVMLRAIKELDVKMTDAVIEDKGFGRGAEIRMNAISTFFDYPVLRVKDLSRYRKISNSTANLIIKDFVRLGFLVEVGEHGRHRLFQFKPYLELLASSS